MAQSDEASQASIISIIREMVKSGESEETIVKSLKELGISEKDAKKLLLMGEADTFALLESEINKMVKQYFEREKPALARYIKKQVEEQEQEMVDRVENRALSAFKEDQKFIENQATMFQARVNQSVKNILELNQETKRQITDLGGRIANAERDVWTIKERVFGSKTVKLVSLVLLTLEGALVGATAYLLFTGGLELGFETMVAAGVVAAVLATIVFMVRLKA